MSYTNSLSALALHQLALSDYLSPSRAAQLHPLPSLERLFKDLADSKLPAINLFKPNSVEHKWYHLGELYRLTLRTAAIFAVSVFIAPVGVLYHLYQAGKYTILHFKEGEENLSKAQIHAWACLKDLGNLVLFGITPSLTICHAFQLISHLNQLKRVFSISYLAIINLGWYAFDPKSLLIDSPFDLASFLLSDATSSHDAYLLREEFGIVASDGALFKMENDDSSFKVFFEKLLEIQSTRITLLIKSLSDEKVGIERTYPPTYEAIAQAMDRSPLVNNDDIKKVLRERFDELTTLHQFAERGKAIGMEIFSHHDRSFRVSHQAYFQEVFSKPAPQKPNSWRCAIEKCRKEVESLAVPDECFSDERYKVLRKFMKLESFEPFDILGISSKQQLRKIFFDLRRLLTPADYIHSDEETQRKMQAEVQAILDLVKAAKAMIEKPS